jgi:5-methyltetrahydropteroyltriglutamate--homocysteine methyltransferase
MQPSQRHAHSPDASFEGGTLDCGNGLLLLIRKHLGPLLPGQFLEVRSLETSVEEDLPAWCRLTGNALVSWTRAGAERSFLIRKKVEAAERMEAGPVEVQRIAPLSVMGIGSWPRPAWLLTALHEYLEGRLAEAPFQLMANEAVRAAVEAQERAGVDVVTDGEQRRDSYASFVGARLEGCQLVPITDLLPYVDEPEKFEAELRALDVPAGKVRHPAVFRKLKRTQPLTAHEVTPLRTMTKKPVKVALPGPYLLTRTMWLECVSERVYQHREELAADVVTALRAEVQELLDAGAALVQLDEPVLTEVVFGQPKGRRSFMCGALGERRGAEEELAFATRLIREVTEGLPTERLGLHICRGNWSRDESLALAGDYRPLMPLLTQVPVGTFFLELCTPRAGEMEVLRGLPSTVRVGVGVVNPKTDEAEPVAAILERGEQAVKMFGPERVLLNPDCGFATFADNPVSSARVAEAKLAAIAKAAAELKRRHGGDVV